MLGCFQKDLIQLIRHSVEIQQLGCEPTEALWLEEQVFPGTQVEHISVLGQQTS